MAGTSSPPFPYIRFFRMNLITSEYAIRKDWYIRRRREDFVGNRSAFNSPRTTSLRIVSQENPNIADTSFTDSHRSSRGAMLTMELIHRLRH